MKHVVMRHDVFINECGNNIWTARNHGRARQGERAYRQVCGQRGRNVTVALAVSPVDNLVFHSTYIDGMNARRFNDFLAQTRQNLDSDEEVILIYDSAPTHRNPAIPATNTELEMPPAYSPFLNIVKQAINSLKAAIKGDVARSEIQAPMIFVSEENTPRGLVTRQALNLTSAADIAFIMSSSQAIVH